MVQKLSHVTIFVSNQEAAKDFYVNKLGFEVRRDQKGVQFAGAPEDRFYGVEAIMKDGLANWFSMTQPKPWQG